MDGCVFCRIVRGEVPAHVVYRDEVVTGFRDINPQAPVHVLVIPNQHTGSAAEVDANSAPLLASMFTAANRVAETEGVASSGYRLVFNVGEDAGMSVPHLHLHVLGGRRLAWPPG
jgi:histidine triad (HIT) family protein